MEEKTIMIDLRDPRSEKIAEVLGNKTAKKILELFADREMSESEISQSLKLPSNTIHYNVKKLEDSGLIEKTGGFLWSVKGKRINKYKIANKKIIISPKFIIKGIVPSVFVSALIAAGLKLFYEPSTKLIPVNQIAQGVSESVSLDSSEMLLKASGEVAGNSNGVVGNIIGANSIWAWFFLGALTALTILIVLNWSKYGKQ